jgi:hypothetical protein
MENGKNCQREGMQGCPAFLLPTRRKNPPCASRFPPFLKGGLRGDFARQAVAVTLRRCGSNRLRREGQILSIPINQYMVMISHFIRQQLSTQVGFDLFL